MRENVRFNACLFVVFLFCFFFFISIHSISRPLTIDGVCLFTIPHDRSFFLLLSAFAFLSGRSPIHHQAKAHIANSLTRLPLSSCTCTSSTQATQKRTCHTEHIISSIHYNVGMLQQSASVILSATPAHLASVSDDSAFSSLACYRQHQYDADFHMKNI